MGPAEDRAVAARGDEAARARPGRTGRPSPVSAVVVTYDSPGLLRRCLAALGPAPPVVVVDDASPGGEAQLVRREFPAVDLVVNDRNRGFGTSANAGIRATRTEWVLLLNADAWPLDDGLAHLVREASREPRLGAAGPLLVGAEGREQRSAIRPPLSPLALAAWAVLPGAISRAYAMLRRLARTSRPERLRPGEFLQGGALLVRRAAFDAVGGFDEAFYMYGEDADLCARLRTAGWSVELVTGARFVHVGGGSTGADPGRMQRELLRSWLRLIAKRDGMPRAERARRWLAAALRLRARGSRAPADREAAAWSASHRVEDLLAVPR